jgi:hypothetical protein
MVKQSINTGMVKILIIMALTSDDSVTLVAIDHGTEWLVITS